MRLNSCW
ncbi:hypothetical protein YPPY95_1202, partial [Yersinia pestis PY-95]